MAFTLSLTWSVVVSSQHWWSVTSSCGRRTVCSGNDRSHSPIYRTCERRCSSAGICCHKPSAGSGQVRHGSTKLGWACLVRCWHYLTGLWFSHGIDLCCDLCSPGGFRICLLLTKFSSMSYCDLALLFSNLKTAMFLCACVPSRMCNGDGIYFAVVMTSF